MKNITFTGNLAHKNGGALALLNCLYRDFDYQFVSFMINFIDNYSFQSGGGIYLDGCDMNLQSTYGLLESRSLFKNNTALIGGAIRFFNLKNSFL